MDSGPLHLAEAVGSPTVRVYGPSDPRIYGPSTSEPSARIEDPDRSATRHAVLQGRLPCVPCGNLVDPPCGFLQDPPCLASVSVDDVVGAAVYVLGRADSLGLPTWIGLLSPLAVGVLGVLAWATWSLGVRHYASTGS